VRGTCEVSLGHAAIDTPRGRSSVWWSGSLAAALDELSGQHHELDPRLREHDARSRETVRDEVQHRLSTLGVATSEDLAALGRGIRQDLTAFEGRLERLAGSPASIPRGSDYENEGARDNARGSERRE
jgi:hypothetical protein